MEESGASSDGLSTQVQPASRAGITFRVTWTMVLNTEKLSAAQWSRVANLIHGPVPRRDQAHDTNRLQRDAIVGGVATQRPYPFNTVECFQKILGVPRQARSLGVARAVDGGAHFDADGLRHFLGSGGEDKGFRVLWRS
jgi:hypothetical protein